MTDPILQYKSRRPLPKGHKTIFHPLRATTIEEATVTGNLHVHDDVYKVQLGKTEAELNEKAIPTYGDQLDQCSNPSRTDFTPKRCFPMGSP